VVLESDQLEAATREALRALWDRAFGDRFSEEDATHAFGGVHVLAVDGDQVVGHASAVPRRIRFEGGPWRTVGYVEAVATDPTWQRRGVGTRLMERLAVVIAARWPVALLSTGETRFYERLGWERWLGTSSTSVGTAVVADEEDQGLMLLRLDPAEVPDLTVDVTCEDRSGDAW